MQGAVVVKIAIGGFGGGEIANAKDKFVCLFGLAKQLFDNFKALMTLSAATTLWNR